MNSLGLVLLLLAQVQPPCPGPGSAPLKGLRRPLALGATVPDLARFSLLELGGGAVVVVEDSFAMPVPKATTGLKFMGLRLFRPVPGQAYGQPVMPWMDAGKLGGGPNAAGRIYTMGVGF